MPTLVLDPPPLALEQLLQERTRLDLDRHDEVWEGVLHVIPPASVAHERLISRLHRLLGPYADQAGLELTGAIGIGAGKDNYRVPDLALLRPGFQEQWNSTAALVVEVISPGDETWAKLPFYAAQRVDELLIVDPQSRQVHWQALHGHEYHPIEHSRLIDLGPQSLAEQIDWPN
jgi:Uma2 family endonuclease